MENLHQIKIHILELKLQIAKLELNKSENIDKQDYQNAGEIRDRQNEIVEELKKIKATLITIFESENLNMDNYDYKQNIKNLLLEFENFDEEYRDFQHNEFKLKLKNLTDLFYTESQNNKHNQLESIREDIEKTRKILSIFN
jgi:hypothetical protein